MKKRVLYTVIVLLFPALAWISCKKLDKLTHFNMDYSMDITLPANSIIDLPLEALSPEIETNSDAAFNGNSTHRDLVESIRLETMTFTILSPPEQNFDFMRSVEIFISAEGLEELKVAARYEVPDGLGQYMELETFGTELRDYLKKDRIRLKVRTVTDKPLPADTDIRIHTVFFVDAEILGQ